MRRPFVTLACAVVVALVPAMLLAQDPPPQPAQQEKPKEPRLAFSGDAGILLFQIKSDQTAKFEELITKVRETLAQSQDPVRKQQLTSWKVYKAAEPMGQNALYVLMVDPAVKAAEYDLVMLLAEGLGKDYATPENQAMMKEFIDAFAAGPNRLNLTPVTK